MEESQNIAPQDALTSAFRSEKIFGSNPDELKRLLCALGTDDLNREQDRSKAVIRALTINHIQMAATINKLEETITILNAENGKVAFRVLILTWCALGAALAQVWGVIYAIYFSGS
jgi:hypothetical protein